MNRKKNFYITSPIYYVNDVPHIGHAYTSLACDVLARFKRMDDYEVFFLTGTDEHGQKVEKSALAKGKSPKEFCDEVSQKFRDLADFMGFSNDDFIRTTDERHKKTAQKFWQKLQENGWIYKDVYEGWYAIRDEAFYNEDELVDGKAPTGAEVVWHKEESYFFKLSTFQNNLLALYEAVPDFIQPESKRSEVISFVKSGLKDLSISRTSFKWGIPVLDDKNHIMYVWLDALVNYLSALDFDKDNHQLYQDFWCNTTDSPIHIVGKDILRFHCVYWPAFLMAADLPLPNRVFAHGWWTNDGQKISKSVGNVIDPYKETEWLQSFKYKESETEKNITKETAIDYFRYFLMKEIPFGNDGDYSRKRLAERINAELANNIGNLVQRCLSMVFKNCDGKVPECNAQTDNSSSEILSCELKNSIKFIKEVINRLDFNYALNLIINLSNQANKNFNDFAPWKLKKEGKINEMNQILYQTIENIRIIAILLLPFIPNSANKILDLLNIKEGERNFENINNKIKSEHKIKPTTIIFPSITNK